MSRIEKGVFIGLDWGTSSLRGWLFDSEGHVLVARTNGHGILHLPEGGFPAALKQITDGWPAVPILACGMVGSLNGWRQVPYLDCPVSMEAFDSALDRAPDISIVPGLRLTEKLPDVMRGEETQIIGALVRRSDLADASLIILPGTHCKWARISKNRVVSFRTFMTGELFSLLMHHSILGRGSTIPSVHDEEAFRLGVRTSREGETGLSAHLFSARSLMLAGRIKPEGVRDYLSGLLLGDEVRCGLALLGDQTDDKAVLLGEAQLCRRYAKAFEILGDPVPELLGNTADTGLFHLARAAKLIESDTE
ncbi:2-dehydro-3-deoxygalactonokinase [Kozakia baliensis]|uniref:Uncharacterized protein n=1 Tax=Kozakia baliensis TaxID=153496 RepID=A0A1D8UW44_9PROT|nr:2-dehydro-3-deoxygalactonokinase [Kozakia baliensis]AOX17850.1 hypothetical protein A0U89_12730 [Kozakia baliensis]GBR26731.1 2-keto-3-deoxy-galactonokinase [Kozakia baliensis NRIC 0488]GEL64280.1 2-dehydro-3-deoxygalactonokinase [Kozakia baliensis]